jgi:hypothetical protein
MGIFIFLNKHGPPFFSLRWQMMNKSAMVLEARHSEGACTASASMP